MNRFTHIIGIVCGATALFGIALFGTGCSGGGSSSINGGNTPPPSNQMATVKIKIPNLLPKSKSKLFPPSYHFFKIYVQAPERPVDASGKPVFLASDTAIVGQTDDISLTVKAGADRIFTVVLLDNAIPQNVLLTGQKIQDLNPGANTVDINICRVVDLTPTGEVNFIDNPAGDEPGANDTFDNAFEMKLTTPTSGGGTLTTADSIIDALDSSPIVGDSDDWFFFRPTDSTTYSIKLIALDGNGYTVNDNNAPLNNGVKAMRLDIVKYVDGFWTTVYSDSPTQDFNGTWTWPTYEDKAVLTSKNENNNRYYIHITTDDSDVQCRYKVEVTHDNPTSIIVVPH